MSQEMLNSPILCQSFVKQTLEIIHIQFLQSIIYQCIDHILLADSYINASGKMFNEVKRILLFWVLKIAPEKKSKNVVLVIVWDII